MAAKRSFQGKGIFFQAEGPKERLQEANTTKKTKRKVKLAKKLVKTASIYSQLMDPTALTIFLYELGSRYVEQQCSVNVYKKILPQLQQQFPDLIMTGDKIKSYCRYSVIQRRKDLMKTFKKDSSFIDYKSNRLNINIFKSMIVYICQINNGSKTIDYKSVIKFLTKKFQNHYTASCLITFLYFCIENKYMLPFRTPHMKTNHSFIINSERIRPLYEEPFVYNIISYIHINKYLLHKYNNSIVQQYIDNIQKNYQQKIYKMQRDIPKKGDIIFDRSTGKSKIFHPESQNKLRYDINNIKLTINNTQTEINEMNKLNANDVKSLQTKIQTTAFLVSLTKQLETLNNKLKSEINASVYHFNSKYKLHVVAFNEDFTPGCIIASFFNPYCSAAQNIYLIGTDIIGEGGSCQVIECNIFIQPYYDSNNNSNHNNSNTNTNNTFIQSYYDTNNNNSNHNNNNTNANNKCNIFSQSYYDSNNNNNHNNNNTNINNECKQNEINSSCVIAKLFKNKNHKNIFHELEIMKMIGQYNITGTSRLAFDNAEINYIETDSNCILLLKAYNGALPLNVLLDFQYNFMIDDILYYLLYNFLLTLVQLHNIKVIHLDIKPENILMTRTGQTNEIQNYILPLNTKLIDYGVAQIIPDNNDYITTDYDIGTPGYIAPEIINDKKCYFASDIYSLGITTVQLITGNKPTVNVQDENIFVLQCKEFVSQIQTNYDPIFGSLIGRMLEYNPSNRPTAMIAAEEVHKLINKK